MSKRSAFTLLEVLVTVFIFAVALGFSLLYTQLGSLKENLNTQASILEAHLREAQSNSTSGKGNGSFGVHFDATAYTLFSGTTFDVNSTSNFVVTLPEILTLSAVTLQGGGSDLVFDPPLGDTDEYGTFRLSSSRTGEILTFTISPLGHVSYE